MDAHVISLANQKGGTAKTTTCANLGIGLAQAGRKVLLVDADAQGSLTLSLGWEPDELPITLYDLMIKAIQDRPVIHGEGMLHHEEGVDLLPANIELAGMEMSLVSVMYHETMVDERKLAFNPAVEVSYLKRDEQRMLLEAMDAEQTTPSLSQAQWLKKFSQEGRLTEEAMSAIMSEEKKSDMDKVTLRSDTLRRYFPKSYTPKQMEQTIIKLLDVWQKQRQKNQER